MEGETDARPGDGVAEGETEQKDLVTLADDEESEEEIQVDEGEDSEEDDGEESEGEAKPKRGRTQRLREKVRRLERENADLRRPRGEQVAVSDEAKSDDPPKPKEEDFPNDFMAYQEALADWREERLLLRMERRQAEKEVTAREREAQVARRTTFNHNLEKWADRIPDFKQVMDAADFEITNALRDQIMESEKGPLLAYYLAKNPDKAAELDRMHPLQAARKLGQLEARIRGPQPKAATQAKKPASPPKGGTAKPPSDPAKMSPAEYRAWREAGNG